MHAVKLNENKGKRASRFHQECNTSMTTQR